MADPFTASFGISPPLLVGRDAVLSEFDETPVDGPGTTGRGRPTPVRAAPAGPDAVAHWLTCITAPLRLGGVGW